MRTKKAVALCMAIVLLFAVVPSIGASGLPGGATITPFWMNVNSIETSIYSSGTNATCSAIIVGLSGSVVISADIYLYKKNSSGAYVYEASWTGLSSATNILIAEYSRTVVRGSMYKLTATARVKRNGVTETVSDFCEYTIP
jgi:hypothetical protein